jgi:hypothetical protein
MEPSCRYMADQGVDCKLWSILEKLYVFLVI